jgi:hypothetical protein
MINLSAFKQLLGEDAQDMTDTEIEQVRDAQYQLAEIMFSMWAKEKKLTPKPLIKAIC